MSVEAHQSTVSVLICTYNRPELLDQALAALIINTTEKPSEVVIVNGGDERADEIVKRFMGIGSVEVKLIKTRNVNLATSRNVGLPCCTGDIVAMTDDDAEVFPDWITQIKRVHREHPEAGAVGGAIIGAESQHNLLSRLADLTTFPQPETPRYVRSLPGVNVAYKREVLELVGSQDVSLFRGEDVDFNWRVKKLGYEVYFHPDVKVIHHHRPTLRGFWQQHYMYGRAYYLVRQKWPEMYSVYPRRLKTVRDWAKLLNCIGSFFYQPIMLAMKLDCWSDRVRALPIFIIDHSVWKIGMIYQRWKAV